jgi:hypothetical protein
MAPLISRVQHVEGIALSGLSATNEIPQLVFGVRLQQR